MDPFQLQNVLHGLPRGRLLFRYFKDRYALMLVEWIARNRRVELEVLRRSRWQPLLRKEVVCAAIGSHRGALQPEWLSRWPHDCPCYRLTADVWGPRRGWEQRDHQTSRPGQDLVLQLNFSREHDRALERLIPSTPPGPFDLWGLHPVSATQRTLAWSRLDLDLETGEALIEEIQSDWVRFARETLTSLKAIPDRRLRAASTPTAGCARPWLAPTWRGICWSSSPRSARAVPLIATVRTAGRLWMSGLGR